MQASNTISNLTQAQVIYYDKSFVKNLKKNTPYVRCTNRRDLPENSGNQLELFMYQTLGANTNYAPEGIVGTGISVSVLNNKATIGQLADFMNYSDLSLMTAIDPALENGHEELAYRLALSLSVMVKNTADGASAVDASVAMQNSATQPFTKSNIITMVASLLGRDVQAFQNGMMVGVIHPFSIGDATNDTTNNSLSDILKRTAEGTEQLRELPTSGEDDTVPILEWGGVRWFSSTLVTMTQNYKGNSGVTALRAYVFGENGVITISLGKREKAMIGDGNWRNLQLWTNKYNEPSLSDPSRMIGGSTAYNTKFVPTLVPDLTMRLRTLDAPTSIS